MLFSEIIPVCFKDYTKRTNKHIVPGNKLQQQFVPIVTTKLQTVAFSNLISKGRT